MFESCSDVFFFWNELNVFLRSVRAEKTKKSKKNHKTKNYPKSGFVYDETCSNLAVKYFWNELNVFLRSIRVEKTKKIQKKIIKQKITQKVALESCRKWWWKRQVVSLWDETQSTDWGIRTQKGITYDLRFNIRMWSSFCLRPLEDNDGHDTLMDRPYYYYQPSDVQWRWFCCSLSSVMLWLAQWGKLMDMWREGDKTGERLLKAHLTEKTYDTDHWFINKERSYSIRGSMNCHVYYPQGTIVRARKGTFLKAEFKFPHERKKSRKFLLSKSHKILVIFCITPCQKLWFFCISPCKTFFGQ